MAFRLRLRSHDWMRLHGSDAKRAPHRVVALPDFGELLDDAWGEAHRRLRWKRRAKNSGALDGEQLIKRWWLMMVDGKIQRCPKWRRSRTWLWWEVTIEKLPQDHSKPSSWSTWWLILRAEKPRETILATKPFETRGCTFAATCVNNLFGSIWSVGVFFWRA